MSLKKCISVFLSCLLIVSVFHIFPAQAKEIEDNIIGNKATVLFGDINQDDIIDNDDVSLLSDYLANTTDFNKTQEILADVTGDNAIGIGDLTCLSRVVGGQQSIEGMPIYAILIDSGFCGKNGSNVKYMLKTDGTLVIFGEGDMADYSISSSANKYVPWKAFSEQIITVQVNEGVTSIGASAFQDYGRYKTRYEEDSIEYVFLPSSLTTIGDSAFLWCDSIEEIIIPNSVTKIGDFAFTHCSKLSNITLSINLSNISEALFEHCNSLKSIKIPNSVKTIGASAFEDSGIETLTIPNTVQQIGGWSFSTLSLREITFEGDITTESYAFSQATNLSKVVFKGKITFTKNEAGKLFNECKNLMYLTIPSEFNYGDISYSIQTCGNFDGCDKLEFKNITFTDNPLIIDDVVFSRDGKTILWYNKNIKSNSYVIPNGVEKIGYMAFDSNDYIEHIIFPDSIQSFSNCSFLGCNNLNNVIIPPNISKLGYQTFVGCNIKSIVIPPSVIDINYNHKASTNTFSGEQLTTVYGNAGTQAETLANNYSAILKDIVFCNFDANGGVVEKSKQAVIPQDKYWVLPTPTRNGYDFDGWYTDKTGGTKVTTESVVNPESSFTLYAHWITDDTEKPSVALSSTNYVSPSQNVTIELSDNVGIKGYYWGTNSSYSNNTFTSTSSASISTTVDSAGTYYATAVDTSGNVSDTQSITFYKTTLDANGGSVSPTSVLTKFGYSFTFPTPTRSGNYVYNGWSTSSSASSGAKSLSPFSNTTHYAIWKTNNNSFVWGQDNWNFINSPSYFSSKPYGTFKYSDLINSSYSEKLKNNLSNTEYQRVFGSYGYLKSTWGGSCYGMAVLNVLSKDGIIPYTTYKSDASYLNNLNKPVDDQNINSLITYYHMLQKKDVIQQLNYKYNNKSNEQIIKELITLLDNKPEVLVCFYTNSWGHAIVATGYEYGSWTYNGITYQGCIKICDPNSSLSYNQNYNIYFNTKTYNWTIPEYYWDGGSSTKGASFGFISADISVLNSGGYHNSSSSLNPNSSFSLFFTNLLYLIANATRHIKARDVSTVMISQLYLFPLESETITLHDFDSLPSTVEKVMTAVPSETAVILPSASTVAISSSSVSPMTAGKTAFDGLA